jgi:hypothetical protein
MADKAYIDLLNEYHLELVSVAHLSAHLLDLMIDLDVPDWQRSGCWLMREKLEALAVALPFPPTGYSSAVIPDHQDCSVSQVVDGGLSLQI